MRLVRICFVFFNKGLDGTDGTPRADLSDDREAVDQISPGKRPQRLPLTNRKDVLSAFRPCVRDRFQ
jgi:hypothetical protein